MELGTIERFDHTEDDGYTTVELVATGLYTQQWDDLTDDQREWEGEDNDCGYIVHGELVFGLNDIMRLDTDTYGDWDGYSNICYSTGYLFRYDHDEDTWDVGYYTSH